MDFSALNKTTANSFHQQKAIIKKVLAGKPVQCPSCKQPLTLSEKSSVLTIKCTRGCTDIQLDKE